MQRSKPFVVRLLERSDIPVQKEAHAALAAQKRSPMQRSASFVVYTF